MSTNRLTTVLLTTIPLTGCTGSRARPGADPVGCALSAGEVPSASGVAAHRCAGADGDTGRPWPRMELPLVRRRARGIGLIHGWYGKPVREVTGASVRMRRNRRIRRQGGRPVHCRAATGSAPSRIAVTETGTRVTWERRVLADACVPPASTCCGPAAVRLRARHERSQERRAGPRGEAASSGSNPTLMR